MTTYPRCLRAVRVPVLLLILLMGVLVHAGAFPRTVTDGLGQELLLQTPPQRIFSTGLAMDNLLLSIVDPTRVVAVTRFATDPAMGSYVADKVTPQMILVDALSPEYVIAANPDIVLVASWNDPDAVEQIRRLGYPVYTFTAFDTINDALDNLRRVGQISGEEDSAEALINGFNDQYSAISNATAHREAPKVLYFNSWSSTVGTGTVIDDIIRYAGGRNVVSEAGIAGWPQIDYEFVLESNPDVIITDSGSDFAQALLNDPLLVTVNAVRDGRVYHIDHTGALDHHLILAVSQLAELLHPEAFAGGQQ